MNPKIQRATESLHAGIPKAEQDTSRPAFHFRPPAQWMNDPNGVIYHKGYYHIFYQLNPYGDSWDHMHWGHARSKDLVHWEHLPIALWPSEELGEAHCFSGCARINGKGEPMLFYTSVAPKSDPRRSNEQWAAIGDDDLIVWQKHPANPILALKTHGGPNWESGWRDPFIFEEAGRTFLVVGAELGEEAVLPIYEAEDTGLTRWKYRGILYRLPKKELQFFECPNFFKLGGKWVLLTSPYKPVHYFVGSFDPKSYTFNPQTNGLLDSSDQYYATNVLFDDRGRCVVFAWIRGFPKDKGWNGCLTLPRILTIGPDGHPRQQPVPELQSLRGKHVRFEAITLNGGTRVLENVRGDCLEIIATFEVDDAKACGLRIRHGDDGSNGVVIRCDGKNFEVGESKSPLGLPGLNGPLTLHLFLDKSVVEVFAFGGLTCVTRVIDLGGTQATLELFAEGSSVRVCSLDVWQIQPIWKNR